MKGLWAIVVSELRDKRTLLIGALVLGVIPWIAPFFPGLYRHKAEDVRGAFMILLGLSLPPVLALGLGASVVGEEVAGRRLGFFFARPLGAGAIWGGKILVALLVPLTCAVLIFTPGAILLLARGRGLSRDPMLASLVLSVLPCAVAHVGAGLYRTRSPWLALDFALAALVAGGFFFVGREMLDRGAQAVTLAAGDWLAAALVMICLAAGFASSRLREERSASRTRGPRGCPLGWLAPLPGRSVGLRGLVPFARARRIAGSRRAPPRRR